MASRAWRPRQYRWDVAEAFPGAGELAMRLGTAPLVAQVLHNRDIDDPEAARAFLDPKLTDLHDPERLPGAAPAAQRVARAVADGEKIVLYGDYDVDGMTAVAILARCLRLFGAEVDYYVPHRLNEGYGVNVEAVGRIVAGGAKLLVTADCGIAAVEPLAAAAAAGADVIVTDHHTPGAELPEAAAIVHPAVPAGAYPNPSLSGAGVAFKLAWQIARTMGGRRRVDEPMREFLVEATCLAALGTIADVVPLRGENRALAAYGLRGLPATRHPGLRALLESARLAGEKLDAYHVGFLLAPRLNACGRMGHARLAVQLLTDAPEGRCRQIAQYLEKQNAQRQKVERAITEQAMETVEAGGLADQDHRAIVLASDEWHGGVIGIVASRLVDRYHRPAVLLAIDGDGAVQGSARSIPGFHVRDALEACSEHLTAFGGHAMAGGLRMKRNRIAAFTAAMLDYASARLAPEELTPVLRLDAETTLPALQYHVVDRLARLGPFGRGNPRPAVAMRSCRVLVPPKRIGRSGQTISLVLEQEGTVLRAVGFGMGELADRLVGIGEVDVAAEPTLNTFNGSTRVELKLLDVRWGS